ncbi:MAG: DEAD/DEAH box helicase [Ktedonobacterales bacterium]|nr:DEAD/DEAH box helicase [Ktedonobacterales bacterium]
MALWAEAQARFPARRSRVSAEEIVTHPRAHPFSAKYVELLNALDWLWKRSRPGVRPRTTSKPIRLPLWLPSQGPRPWPSPFMVAAGWAPDSTVPEAAETPLALWRADALLLDAESAVTLLAGLPAGAEAATVAEDRTAGTWGLAPMVLGSDLRLWAAAARFVLSLLARQRFLPGAIPMWDYDGYGYGPRVAGVWQASLADTEDHARFDALAAAMPPLCRAAISSHTEAPAIERAPSPTALLDDFIQCAVGACVEQWVKRERLLLRLPSTSQPRNTPHRPSSFGLGFPLKQSLAARWIDGLRDPRQPLRITATEVEPLLEGIKAWHAQVSDPERAGFRVCLRLSPPGTLTAQENPGPDEAPSVNGAIDHEAHHLLVSGASVLEPGTPDHETQNGNNAVAETAGAAAADGLGDAGAWQLEYLLQARDDPSLLVPLGEVWRQGSSTARFLDRRFDHPHEAVLASLGQAARFYEPILHSLRQPMPTGCDLTSAEAYHFLVDAAPALEEADFGVLVPPWWKRARVKPVLRIGLRREDQLSSGLMGLEAVVGYDWKLALGGEELTPEEFERLARLKEPLIRLRGRWVELHQQDVEAMLRFVRKHASGRMSLGEALRVSLTGEVADGAITLDEVRADAWIGDLLGRLRGGEALVEIASPDGLRGTLRPYQLRGLGWLAFLTRHGLGACLADDMGLGKTIELLALVLHAKAAGQLTRPVLLVCPTSVAGNWRHEAARFTPDLRLLIHHGAQRMGRADNERFAREAVEHDIVVTTYSLLARDEKTLAAVAWGAIVLDEAQNIKNPETKQSRVARRLQAPVRVALTGTPVENHLAELWSIMDFLNGGYLGSYSRFQQQFATPIEKQRDARATTRLQALVRPFVLRRVKTDPTVIQDLPEKIEMREYCTLTREQVTLYEAVVRDGLRRIEETTDPMQRRGIILSMLVRLKQVCNHPAHLLDDGSDLAGRSGKLIRLEELIEELLAEGDRALIFTQFTAMGERLQLYLSERFDTEVLYLHGGVPRLRRERIVERFQSADGPPLFLLSLKAGGTGLNLTNANHVIHFDRWWNPAVENQATDRAFRIGQMRNVQVRKFVCTGTLEERIDQMIERKRELAEQVIGSGEGWLTELSTEQLRDLFSLRAEALAE